MEKNVDRPPSKNFNGQSELSSHAVHGEEGIVGVHTFRRLLPALGDHPMCRSVQEDPNNFLTDQMSRFWLTSVVRTPKGRQKRSERPSADRFQAVSDTIARDRRLFHHGHFSPHNRSKLDTAIGKRSTRYVYAKRILSVMSDGSPVSANER